MIVDCRWRGLLILQPQFLCAFTTNARQQLNQAFEGDFVARILDEFEVGGDILDVGLLEKANTAGDGEGNAAFSQLELQFERVEMRSVENRHASEIPALFLQLH